MATCLSVSPERPEGVWLPIQDAARWYGVNEVTLYRLLRRGLLSRHKRAGDKRTWLKLDELEHHLRPRLVDPA